MAGKSNIRSIRFSDDLAELIDRQVGDSFTEKFTNLVTRCVWELPQKEEELRRLQEQISRERQRLYDLQTAVLELKQLERSIQSLRRQLEGVQEKTDAVGGMIEEDLMYL